MALVGDGVLAVTKGVPQLDGSVAGTRDNLSVVGREGDREDIVGVADKSSRGGTGSKFPQSEGFVPGSRQGIGTVGGDDLENTIFR